MASMTIGGRAATTEVVRDDKFATLQKGEFEGVAISSDGFLYPAYERNEVGDTGTEIVWDVIDQGKRGVLCLTGHEAKLVRLNKDGEPTVLVTLPDAELTAAVELEDGSVLIAGAPSGNIYRLDAEDALTTETNVGAKFVWDLEVDAEGTVWAATGTEGKLVRITRDGDGATTELACEFPSTNIIDLWIDAEGKMGDAGLIYVGGQDPGWLYRYRPGDEEAKVLYDSAGGEIRAIEPTEKGLAIAVNTQRAPSPQVLKLTLRMTGRARSNGNGEMGGPGKPPSSSKDRDKPKADMGDVFKAQVKKPPRTPVSTVVLVTRDGFSRTLWALPERPIHSLAASPQGGLLVAAGGKGRLFELFEDGEFALVADSKEDFLVGLRESGESWLITAARNGLVFRMEGTAAKEAVYRSRVIDVNAPSQWGRFYWRGEKADGQKITVSVRSGNAEDPDDGNWAEWSKESTLQTGKGVPLPEVPARYLQYRLTMEGGRGDADTLKTDYVEAFYRLPNRAPQIKRVTVSDSKGAGAGGKAASGSKSAGENGKPPARGGRKADPKPQGGGRDTHSNTGAITVSWQAADPNGDDLTYDLYFRAQDEAEWKLIDDELRIATIPLDVKGVADGRYRFRIVATDEFDNPTGEGLQDEQISEEFVIDNTAPVIGEVKIKEREGRTRVQFKVSDALSLISSIQADIDNGDTYPIFPKDTFFDQQAEEIDWETPELEAGEHVITIGVTDRRGNTSVAKKVFRTE